MPPKKKATSAKADKKSVETSSDKSSDNIQDSSNDPKPVKNAKKATKEVSEPVTNGDASPSPPAKRSKKSPGAGKDGETPKEPITNGDSSGKESKRKKATKSSPESSMDSIPENEELATGNFYFNRGISLLFR